MVGSLNPYQLSHRHGNYFFESRFDNFHTNLRKIDSYVKFFYSNA